MKRPGKLPGRFCSLEEEEQHRKRTENLPEIGRFLFYAFFFILGVI